MSHSSIGSFLQAAASSGLPISQHHTPPSSALLASRCITDAHLAALPRSLTALHLSHVSSVTSRGLRHLTTLTSLQSLCLTDALDTSAITGADLEVGSHAA